ncbi:MAG: hypothetical protein JW800_02680 [Candidatus Omnitrophica bacterium]|nr:hypothetical protein [Candidatus Omnitrophota bacterium]
MRRSIKTIIGILLLPLVVSVSRAFYGQFGNIDIFLSKGQQYFLLGIGTYCFIQLFIFKPVYVYVLGHEAMHALATWICLGKVTSFKVSTDGGSITTSKSNLFISLSPYFIPIYSLAVIVLYYLINHVFTDGLIRPSYFMLVLGLTIAFHIVMTVDTLKTRQPDLIKAGYLTSSIFIYVINMTVVALAFGLLFEGFSFRSFMSGAYTGSLDIYRAVFNQLFL